MLNNTAERDRLLLAQRFIEAFPKDGAKLSDVEIGAACKVSKAAPGGWRKTGRIAKRHLKVLAELSGRPLTWWLTGDDDSAVASGMTPAERDLLAALRTLRPHRFDLYRAQIIDEALQDDPPKRLKDWRAG